MVMAGARNKKTHGRMEKNARRLAWFIRKNPLKNSQLANIRKEIMKMYAMGELK
jgi:hypothetical protein